MSVRVLLEINQHLYVQCHNPACRRRVRLSAVEACETIGPDVSLTKLGRRLKCRACGARGRDGFVTAWPCTLDYEAAATRWRHAGLIAEGKATPADLERGLAALRGLLGEAGELGGDGPVQWPIDGPSKPG